MTKPLDNNAFPVLSEQEHEAIDTLWGAGEGSSLSLAERYTGICHAMMQRLVLGDTGDARAHQRAYLDQIAYAVIARAIEDHHLQGSIAGELVEGIYYQGGGKASLESFGRLCFCPAFLSEHPQPTARHASSCDQLWSAYCQAVNAVLVREVQGEPLEAEHLCILDATSFRIEDECPTFKGDPDLQRVVAEFLSLDEKDVRRVWVPINWQPVLPDSPVSFGTITAALKELGVVLSQRNISLFVQRSVLVVDDTATAASTAVLVLNLRRWMGDSPIVLGVRLKRGTWHIVEPTPTVTLREES